MDNQSRELLRALTSDDIQPLIAQYGLPAVQQMVARFKADGLIAGKLREAHAGTVRSMLQLTPKGRAALSVS